MAFLEKSSAEVKRNPRQAVLLLLTCRKEDLKAAVGDSARSSGFRHVGKDNGSTSCSNAADFLVIGLAQMIERPSWRSTIEAFSKP